MNRHVLPDPATSLAAAALLLCPLAAQSVTIEPQVRTLDLLVEGTETGTPVMLVGYVSVVANVSPEEPPYGALATATFSPFLDDVAVSGSEYLPLITEGLAASVEPLGSSFRIPYWVVEKTMRDYDAVRIQSGPLAELTQARQVGATALHWSPTPSTWTASFPRPIPWSLTVSSSAPPPALDYELLVRAFVAHQFENEPTAGSGPASTGLFHQNVEQVVKAIHAEWGEYTLHLQALVLLPSSTSGGPPIVKVTPTSSIVISLPDDPGVAPVLRLVRGPNLPYLYTGMPGVPFALELAHPVVNPTQLENLAILFPSAAGGDGIAVHELFGSAGSKWLDAAIPALAASGPVRVVDVRLPGTPLALAQPHDGSPPDYVDFVRYQAPGQ
jgi:hypothetical protein